VNAGQAVNRVIGMFDKDEEKQIRQRLADTIRWVVGQRLVPKVGGGRWAVHDILANTIRSNELILNGEAEGKTFYEIQEVGEPFGMMTFDQSLLKAYQQGLVTEDTAVNYSTRKAVVQRGIDTVKQTRGEKTTDLDGLKLDTDYNRAVFGAARKR
jgi:twitching motility protein PilT